MKKHFSLAILAVASLFAAAGASAETITKAPDIGSYWTPLGNAGTNIYANSFIAPITGTVTELGLWLRGGPSDLKFQIYGSVGGLTSNGPDSSTALVTSGIIAGQTLSDLTYISATPASSATLTAGQTYWFAATGVGLSATSSYSVGGHTQNSGGIVDNGTFWYSNAADGLYFDGRGYTPEMAFQVTMTSAVPEPESIALVLAGLVVVAGVARRRA